MRQFFTRLIDLAKATVVPLFGSEDELGWLSPARYLTVKSKLILLLLLVNIGSLALVAVVVERTQRATLNQTAFEQLASRRNASAKQVQLYIGSMRNQVTILAENRLVIAAMMGLQMAYDRLAFARIEPDWDKALTQYYQSDYVPELSKHLSLDVSLEALRPTSKAARFLQYHYVVTDKKPGKLTASDPCNALYAGIHNDYHPQLAALAARSDFTDLLLVSYDREEVIYSVAKYPDLGTSLRTGPYAYTHLSKLVGRVKQKFDTSGVSIVDFDVYPPTRATPAAFLGSMIHDPEGQPIGIMVAELSPAKLDHILTDSRAWRENGQGETGETYVVGPDRRMRTTSRFLVEAPDAYVEDIRASGQSELNISLIKQFKSSILFQSVETEGAREALAGRRNVRILEDYRGHSVLTAYAPVNLEGLTWGIISQVDADEAFRPVTTLLRQIFMTSIILIILIIFIAIAASTILLRPLRTLTDFTANVLNEEDAFLDAGSDDEFGVLAQSINDVAIKMQFQTAILEQRTEENEALLHSILPGPVAHRIKRGEERITDTLEQASVVNATVVGFIPLFEQRSVQEATDILNDLIQALDDAAERQGLERQRTVGDTYLAVCGLATFYLDHPSRAVQFAKEAIIQLEEVNMRHGTALGLKIGIDSGRIVAGLLGGSRFMYNMWGRRITTATQLSARANRNSILITDAVYERLEERDVFVCHTTIDIEEVGSVAIWSWQHEPIVSSIVEPNDVLSGAAPDVSSGNDRSDDGAS